MSYQDQVSSIAAELEEILDLDDLERQKYISIYLEQDQLQQVLCKRT